MSGGEASYGGASLRLLISGHVQGVGYRGWLVAEARRLGITGWVRNLVDGRVEALLQGEPAMVERLVEACGDGPGGAIVRRVDRVATRNVRGEMPPTRGFEQR